MCGIAGFLELPPRSGRDELAALARRMADRLRHRGPDDEGTWVEPAAGLAFGHRRLAIVDLSRHGRQPMSSASGRFTIAYNGEIYDHHELRLELEAKGQRFRGHSDTEVILAGCETWGLRATLARCTGMFALALWDAEERRLTLARDRLGEKPLYWGVQRHGGRAALLFGSEIKALAAHPSFIGGIDRDVLVAYLRFSCVPAPHSILKGLHQLRPGHLLELQTGTWSGAELPESEAWWSAAEAARRGFADPLKGSRDEVADEVERALSRSLEGQRLADVPVGAFLSGGIDSSTVVALLQGISRRPVKTFTVGFEERSHDESRHAARIAAHLGTDHHTLTVSSREALELVPSLPTIWDEPFGDSSQVPTHLIARLARSEVSVALSGDGGDELFAGYERHLWADRLWRVAGGWPRPLRRLGAAAVTAVPARAWTAIARAFGPLAPVRARRGDAGEKLHRLVGTAAAPSLRSAYRRFVGTWHEPERLVVDGSEPPSVFDAGTGRCLRFPDALSELCWLDLVTYLPNDILVKLDRAAMACSLETRVPLLDHRLVELSFRVPSSHSLRDGKGKQVLRRILRRRVPEELWDRPKTGFGVPIGEWLRGPLRGWAEALLSEERLRREGWLRPEPVRAAWRAHLAGRPEEYRLWTVLMFQAWLETWSP